ncbi:MAG TPA: nucleotide exchange factor GrpE [Marmoricola sp.]|nr:nucleotide exchange factor GrpE [Marmoricola sp.]
MGGEPRASGAPHTPEQPGSFGDTAGEMSNETEVEVTLDSVTEGDPAAEMVEEGAPVESVDYLSQARAELAERTADLQRLQAEYVNYKKRVDRDRDLVRANAVASVLTQLLPVLDDIDRAREHGELEGGFKAVADSLLQVVSGLGLSKYADKGDEFDPMIHEALMHGQSAEVSTEVVDVVAQPGYRIEDRVVRPAKVTVLGPE